MKVFQSTKCPHTVHCAITNWQIQINHNHVTDNAIINGLIRFIVMSADNTYTQHTTSFI